MLPSISNKFYQSLVSTMIGLPHQSSERRRLGILQKQLAQAQMALAATKSLDTWLKAG